MCSWLEPIPSSRGILQKLTASQLVKKFPVFLDLRFFITMFIRAHHWIWSWARWIQPEESHHLYLISILILCRQVVSSLQVLSKISNAFLISPMYATCLAHGILIDLRGLCFSLKMMYPTVWNSNTHKVIRIIGFSFTGRTGRTSLWVRQCNDSCFHL